MTLTDSDIKRFWSKVWKGYYCWEWTASINDHGYGQLMMRSMGRPVKAHRISWQIHNGPIPDGMFVCHHCDNPPCVNPEHLFLGDYTENAADKIAKGRHGGPRGNAHPNMVLGSARALEIKKLLAIGISMRSIAKQYGVSHTAISRIKRGITWQEVKA